MLTGVELSRYQRQLSLPEVGLQGQARLRAARILIVGAGGLGSPAALYLAAAGVGTLGLVDDDTVDVSNLHRQILHGTPDIGRPKPDSASEAIRRLNPDVHVDAHRERLNRARAESLFTAYDVIIDGSDNFPTRYIINDVCAALGKPWVYGSVERFSGQVSVFGAANGPCYRCLYPEAPPPGSTPSCEEIGVLGAVPGVVGSLQAVEAMKLVLGLGEPLIGRLLQMDLQTATVRTIAFARRSDCVACGGESRKESRVVESAGNRTQQSESPDNPADDIQPQELAHRLTDPAIHLLDVRDPWEWAIATIERSRRLPMNQLPEAVDTLDRGLEHVLYCHHGVRSGMAAEWLRAQGFRARNLAGGIDRWSCEVDSAVPRY